jgi:hypothetical protein
MNAELRGAFYRLLTAAKRTKAKGIILSFHTTNSRSHLERSTILHSQQCAPSAKFCSPWVRAILLVFSNGILPSLASDHTAPLKGLLVPARVFAAKAGAIHFVSDQTD